jgi:hypothetical protein
MGDTVLRVDLDDVVKIFASFDGLQADEADCAKQDRVRHHYRVAGSGGTRSPARAANCNHADKINATGERARQLSSSVADIHFGQAGRCDHRLVILHFDVTHLHQRVDIFG